MVERDVSDDDPVYNLMLRMLYEVAAFNSRRWTPSEALEEFFRIKAILVDHLPRLHPKIAKMGLGRGALFSMFADRWEGKVSRLHMWSVCFTRTFLLLSAYVFFMLNAFGKADEFSKGDDVWAHKKKPEQPNAKAAGGLCDLVYEGDPSIAQKCAADVAGVMRCTVPLPPFLERPYGEVNPKAKLLGMANSWVLAFLRSAASGQPVAIYLAPDLVPEMEAAKAYLIKAGWDAGLNRFASTAGSELFVAQATSVFAAPHTHGDGSGRREIRAAHCLWRRRCTQQCSTATLETRPMCAVYRGDRCT